MAGENTAGSAPLGMTTTRCSETPIDTRKRFRGLDTTITRLALAQMVARIVSRHRPGTNRSSKVCFWNE